MDGWKKGRPAEPILKDKKGKDTFKYFFKVFLKYALNNILQKKSNHFNKLGIAIF